MLMNEQNYEPYDKVYEAFYDEIDTEEQKLNVNREMVKNLKNEKIISKACNEVLKLNDPTAHAEIVALRQAAHNSANYSIVGEPLCLLKFQCA